MNLYEILKELEKVDHLIDEAVDQDTGVIPEDLCTILDTLELEKNIKIGELAKMVKNLDSESDACKLQGKRFYDRAKRADNKAARIKSYLSYVLQGLRFKDEFSEITFRNSQAVKIINEVDIPAFYLRSTESIEPDKDKIKRDLKSGMAVPGAELETRFNVVIK